MYIYEQHFIPDTEDDNRLKCIYYKKKKEDINDSPDSRHYHNHMEIIYIKHGTSAVYINNNIIPLKSHEMIVIPPNIPHSAVYEDNTEFICLIFSNKILYSAAYSVYDERVVKKFFTSQNDVLIFNSHETSDAKSEVFINEITDEYNNKEPAYEFIIRANILKLIFFLLRNRNKEELHVENDYPEEIKKATEYIKDHYNNVTVQDVVQFCNMSYSSFVRLFKKYTNTTFIEYLTNIKLHEAKKQLIVTNKSITDISMDLGFSTTSHFIKIFKKSNGITPKKYREIYIKKENTK